MLILPSWNSTLYVCMHVSILVIFVFVSFAFEIKNNHFNSLQLLHFIHFRELANESDGIFHKMKMRVR